MIRDLTLIGVFGLRLLALAGCIILAVLYAVSGHEPLYFTCLGCLFLYGPLSLAHVRLSRPRRPTMRSMLNDRQGRKLVRNILDRKNAS